MSPSPRRTQVGIVGAGPAGLLLSHLLHRENIESVLLENRTEEYVIARVRAGVLEQRAVDVFRAVGLGGRMDLEGLVHHGIELRFEGQGHRIALSDLTAGRSIMVYGQNKVVEDLIEARRAAGGELHYEVDDVSLHDLDTDRPSIGYRHQGRKEVLECDVVAGCDGFHGVSRASIPAGVLTEYERVYPFAWLGILAEVAPSTEELIYAYHERGFALHSLRSPELSRLYVQVPAGEDLADWPDERVWSELHFRLGREGWKLDEGPVVEKGIAPLRSFVAEPMRYGRLFLAGDAAHIVPPTGAKGLNLAVADVVVLARALTELFATGSEIGLDTYSDTCLRRVWQAERFSWWMTSMLHRFPDEGPFLERLQLAELRYVTSSEAAARTLAENYVGLDDL
jgi:p-hydroxybenzoate 3-monooxygenase